jgi:hypothetical protein
MSKAGTPKSYGIPSFVQLAASLHTQELLAPQAAQLPAVEEMNRLYQKIESLLSVHSSNIVLSAAQKVWILLSSDVKRVLIC